MSMPRTPGDQPLTPLSFLERSALVFADRTAVIDGARRFTYRQFADRCARVAGGLIEMGVRPGDRVAVLAPNTRVMLEAHYGVPMAGGVLVALNYRLAAGELAYIIDHSGANVLIYDHEWSDVVAEIAGLVEHELLTVDADGPDRAYEDLIAGSKPVTVPVADERSLISINYTSGTTGRPKGVMYVHRGAYLQALSVAYHSGIDTTSVVLWTLPMFHCNGWTYTWGITAAGGTHLCLRRVDAGEIWRLLRDEGVTHFNGAPTVLTMVAYHPAAGDGRLTRQVEIATGGAPPSPAILARMAELDMHVTHLYGLTETYGPATICQWQPEWDGLDIDAQAELKARQGVGTITSEAVRVVDEHGDDVPTDGATIGEVSIRGNNLMVGYYRDEESTERAIPDGWFRTGDLGVMHPDGYVELRDRAKDIIISGGENIASIEVEQAVASHPDVLEVAVIAHTDETWGEIPVVYVTRQPGTQVTGDDIIEHVRSRIAHFKAPKRVIFTDLPKTSTGKVQKYVLRAAAEGPPE